MHIDQWPALMSPLSKAARILRGTACVFVPSLLSRCGIDREDIGERVHHRATAPHVLSAVEDTSLRAAFLARTSGWLGADSATSVRLNSSHHLWLWADTLWGSLGKSRDGTELRDMTAFLHNTIAIVDDLAASPEPIFFARRLPDSEGGLGELDPRGFFRPHATTTQWAQLRQTVIPFPRFDRNETGIFYWPVAGTVLPRSGALLCLAQVMGPENITDFRGTDAILVRDFTDVEPERWRYSTSRIAASSRNQSWNGGVHASDTDGFVYIIGMRESAHQGSERTQHLARIDEASLLAFDWSAMRFWAGDALGWSANPADSAALYSGPYTEGTMTWHPMGFVYVLGCQAYDDKVMLHTARNVTGPWTSTVAYVLPPLGEQVAYAAKSHPQLATARNEIVFSYNINGDDFDVLHNTSIYTPRFVRLALEDNSADLSL